MRKLLHPAIVLPAIVGILYAAALNAPFVYDDRIHIIENPLVLGFHSAFDSASWKALVQTAFGWSGRPLLFLTYGLNYSTSGLDPARFRMANIAIHAINALLVYAIARRLAEAAGRKQTESRWIAWAAGLIFAAHPLATESVVYIAGRSSSLCALFYFAGLAAFLEVGKASWSRPWIWGCLAGACLAAGLLVKQDAMMFPAVACALAFVAWPAGFSWRRVAAGVLAIVFGLGAWLLQHASIEDVRRTTLENETLVAAGFNRTLTLPVYMMTAVKEWTFYYLWRLFLPIHLSVDPAPPDVISPWAPLLLISAVVIVGLCAVAIWAYRRDCLLSSSLALLVISPLAAYCVFPLADVVSEHRAYITLSGSAILMAVVLARFSNRLWWTAAIIVIFAIMTSARNSFWMDEQQLWEDASRKAPGTLRPHLNLGAIYQSRGMGDRAILEYQVVLTSAPNHDAATANLGSLYLEKNQLDLAESLLNRAVARESKFAPVYLNLGVVRLRQGRFPEAKEMLQRARQLNPRQLMIGLNLGDIAFNERRFQDAIPEYLGELKINPGSVITHFHLARAYEVIGNTSEAVREYRAALDGIPGNAEIMDTLRRLDPSFRQ